MDDVTFNAEKLRREAQSLVNQLHKALSTEDESEREKQLVIALAHSIITGQTAGEFHDALKPAIMRQREEG